MSEIDTSTSAIAAIMDGVTPGPWQSDSAFCKGDHHVRVAMPDWAGVPQATVCECDHNWDDADCGERRISWREAEANARFIAAARDLVPALAAERDELLQALRSTDSYLDKGLDQIARNVTRAAILKHGGANG